MGGPDGQTFAFWLVGVALVVLGVVHLWKTSEVFDFYKSFNDKRIGEGRPWLQMLGGASPATTRVMGWLLVALGAMAFIGGLTER
jgi:hypothetical protein